jgi:hypothetical protein
MRETDIEMKLTLYSMGTIAIVLAILFFIEALSQSDQIWQVLSLSLSAIFFTGGILFVATGKVIRLLQVLIANVDSARDGASKPS